MYLSKLTQWLQHVLSRMVGWVMCCKQPLVKRTLIKWLIKRYQINMVEAAEPDINKYQHVNDFFTRHLKPGVRPVVTEGGAISCPVDGEVSQVGRLAEDKLLQAKGAYYSAETLLGGVPERAAPFINGEFACFYLAPKDYHRVHMPVTGTLKEMIHVPGHLFSVNQRSVEKVPQLFACNERVVSIFETENGPMAVVMVGAMLVASMATVWAGVVAPKGREQQTLSPPITLERGEEMGHFQFGSTVIVLFGPGQAQWVEGLVSGTAVQMGQGIGKTHHLVNAASIKGQHQQTV